MTYIQVKQFLKQKINKFWVGLDFVHGELTGWLDGCGFLLVDLMWVTGCPALAPVNASEEMLQEGGESYFDKTLWGHMNKVYRQIIYNTAILH